MICVKCGEEVVTKPGKSANFCPNCGNSIEAEKSGGWQYFDNTKELLAHIATEYGLDALFGRKHFSDHTSPTMPQGQKNLVKQAFECGAVKILQENMSSDQARKEIAAKQAVKKLTDFFYNNEVSERVVWEFTNALGWGLPEPKADLQAKPNTRSQAPSQKPSSTRHQPGTIKQPSTALTPQPSVIVQSNPTHPYESDDYWEKAGHSMPWRGLGKLMERVQSTTSDTCKSFQSTGFSYEDLLEATKGLKKK
jgi:hypothetical protein